MAENRRTRRGSLAIVQEFAGPSRPHADAGGRGVLWQTAQLNSQYYEVFYNELLTLAMNRYRWINLPETCDESTLEKYLVEFGQASIAFPQSRKGEFYVAQVSATAPLNLYDRATRWRAIGNNGFNYAASYRSGVVCYENRLRYPLMQTLQMYAQELADIRITKTVNRYHQRVPMVLTGPQDAELDLTNIAKQVGGGEPMIITHDGLNIEYQALTNKPAPFIGKDLTEEERAVWAAVYDALGIPNVIYKQERQITSEVQAQNSQTSILRLAGLRERRRAADYLNRVFAEYLDAPISVVHAEDYESYDWNKAHTLSDSDEGGENNGI